MSGTDSISIASLKRLCIDAFRHAGLSAKSAETTTGILVEADMMGLHTHGVVRIPVYTQRLRSGGVNPKAHIGVEQGAPSLAVVDGDNGLGPVIASRALEVAFAIVAETGLAYVGCNNSNHFGALAPYALRACEAGYVLLGGTNASTTMAPWGGKEARLGNNPLCVAAPCADGAHFILDMAMSVAARGKIRAAHVAGAQIPQGWALDRAGISTIDPGEALEGFLLPFGGHKGSGLAMAVDILSAALCGARFLSDVSSWSENPDAPSGVGHFFLLLDPDKTIGADAFAIAMERFKAIVLTTPAADSTSPVMLPGQRELERRHTAMTDGICLATDLLASIRRLASGPA